MHALNLMWMAVSFEIVAVVAVLFFLGKAAKDGYASWMKWLGYLLLIGGICALLCSFANGCRNMMHPKEECHAMMGHGSCPMMGGSDGDMKECHEGMMKGGKECCKGKKGKCEDDDDDDDHHDSTKAKK